MKTRQRRSRLARGGFVPAQVLMLRRGGHWQYVTLWQAGRGGLCVSAVFAADRFDFIRNFPKCYDGSHIHHPCIWTGQARRIDLEFDEPMDIMIDGEVMTVRMQSLEVLPSAMNVMV